MDLLAVSMSAFHWTFCARGYDLGISQKKSRLARTLARHASLTQCPINRMKFTSQDTSHDLHVTHDTTKLSPSLERPQKE